MKFLSSKKKITDVQIGDLILACDINQNKDVYRKVINTMRPIVESEHQVRITTSSGATLITSDTHPTAIFTDKIEYVKGGEVTVNDYAVTTQVTKDKVTKVDNPNVNKQYADFSVDEFENYYAGMEPDKLLLAHNSCTVFYPIWHYQFDDLIVLKNNQGTEETRVRHLDYGVVLSGFFWRRFRNQENITFFDPNDVPDLYDAFYQDSELFETLYTKYESQKNLRKKVMSAEDVFKNGLLKERTDTGRIYIVNIDNVMNQGPFDPLQHTIYQSNLCCVVGSTKISILDDVIKTIRIDELDNYNLATIRIKSYKDGEILWQPVSAFLKTKTVTELYTINSSLHCTNDHPIYTVNRGYVNADQLTTIDTLLLDDGSTVKATVEHNIVTPTDVYDITVTDSHCFFADGVLVHNCEILLPTVALGSTTKKYIRVKKELASEFLLNKPEEFVNIKRMG